MHRIPLKEVHLSAMVATGVRNSNSFTHDVPIGQRLTDIGIGVVVENPGKPDILLYPAILLRAVTLEDKRWSTYGMTDEEKLEAESSPNVLSIPYTPPQEPTPSPEPVVRHRRKR